MPEIPHELWVTIRLSLTLAALTSVILLVLATPVAWWLARARSWWKEPVAAILTLPLVLPPTVLGFYLLMMLGPHGPGGWLASLWGARTLAFSFPGLLIGSVVYSLPFAIQPIRNAFAAIGPQPLEVAASLRASPWRAFATIAVPMALPGLMTGLVLGFAHTLGEFGIILMIGGNIPGQTRMLSVALFDYVETLQWQQAHLLAGGMALFSFLVILAMMLLERWTQRRV